MKTFFIPLYKNFIPWKFFHTLIQKFHTLPRYFSYPQKQFHTLTFKFLFSYLKNFFHTPIQKFHTLWKLVLFYAVLSFHTEHKYFVPWSWYFIPSGQVFIPPTTNFILISFSTHLIARLIVCTHSFTTERTSHVCGCFLWPNFVAQSSSGPTGWLWPAPTAPTCQV
jgi:hypothetical protein